MKHKTIRIRSISLAPMLAGIRQAPFTLFGRAVRQSAFASLLLLGGLATAGANPLDAGTAGTWTQVGKMSAGAGGMFNGSCALSASGCTFDDGNDFWSEFPTTFSGQKILFITGDRKTWVVADYDSVASIIAANAFVLTPNITWLDAGLNGTSLGNDVVGNIAKWNHRAAPLVTLRGKYCANQATVPPFPDENDCNLLLWAEGNWNTNNAKSLMNFSGGVEVYVSAPAVNLVAIAGQWSPDGGSTQIPMWGFATDTGQACDSLPTWDVGPQLTDWDLVTGDLTINLRNCLSEGVSLVIPGKPAESCNGFPCVPETMVDGQGRTRVTAFTTEPAVGGTITYVWTGISDGTYLYQSGSHPAKQVQMGLYGALTIKGSSYPDAHDEVTLLYSEIDPELHSPPTAATPLGYNPSHYLVNGETSASFPAAGDTNHPTLLRFLNAGLDFHVPALNSGYMDLVAEDGNAYPFPKRQYSVNLAAGKTIDALWQAPTDGDYVIYDRSGNGMVATLTMAAGIGQPIAVDDAYSVAEDGSLNEATLGVLSNDTDADLVALAVPPSSAALASSTSAGSIALNADGSFAYTPNPGFNGQDTFTYRANDGDLDSNVATVTITVTAENDTPVAIDDAYDVIAGTTLSVAAAGVLVNDTDVDGDTLSAVLSVDSTTPGALTLSTDGSFVYDSSIVATGTTTESFTYFASDGTENSADAATVTLNIITASNSAPVAVPDAKTVQRNSAATFINLTNNDYDVDGNLKDGFGFVTNGNPGSGDITITTGYSTTRGGTVSIVSNGVNYTPRQNFRGTDTFSYTVTDTSAETSNEVTVRVNVVK